MMLFFFFALCNDQFYFPAQFVRGFTLKDLLDKVMVKVMVSGVLPFHPPVRVFIFIARRVQHSHCFIGR